VFLCARSSPSFRGQADGAQCESMHECLAEYRDWGATERDCHRCLRRLPARRRSLIASLPPVLVLALKRAKRNPRGAGRFVRSAHKVAVSAAARLLARLLSVCWRVCCTSTAHLLRICCASAARLPQRMKTPRNGACIFPRLRALQIETELIIRGDADMMPQADQDSQQPMQQDAVVTLGDSHVYRLCAVVRHVGSSLNSGHYIADVLVRDAWFRFNDDETVKHMQRSARARAGVAPDGPFAYVLFYERQAS
jgi:Ubiquitin carboxyl-terminal hydrolase